MLNAAQFGTKRSLSLGELRAIALKITNYYHAHGYFLAQAYLPAQDIKDETVTIAVLEGQYGKVSLQNKSRLSDSVANQLLGGLRSGDTVAVVPLETRLLLLSDLPGVEVKSTLVPGASVGASDLIVDVLPGRFVSGSLDADNRGNRYTGRNRGGSTVNLNNPSGHGDVLTVRALASNAGLRYARVGYQAQIERATLGLAYSTMKYRLGEEFSSLDARGEATITSLYGRYPLLRSRTVNLSALVDLESKDFHDSVGSVGTATDKKARSAMFSLEGDARDGFGGGGMSSFGATLTSGEIDIVSPAARASDAQSVRSNGRFSKLSVSLTRQQSMSDAVTLYAAVNGQFASKNLDTSEKMGLGGAGAVRAYPEGEAYGDQGYVVNLEARLRLPGFMRMPGQFHLVGFVDAGSMTINKNVWTTGQNHRTLSGIGFGLNWVESNNFAIKASLARKLGHEVATSAPDAKSRFWLQALKSF